MLLHLILGWDNNPMLDASLVQGSPILLWMGCSEPKMVAGLVALSSNCLFVNKVTYTV